MIRQAKREAEEIIASLREQFDDQGTKKRSQAIQNARDRLRHAEEENSVGIMSDGNYRRRINIKKLSIGDTVYIPRLDQKGTVLEIHGKNLTLQIGILRMELDSSQCRFVGDSEKVQEDRVEKSRMSFVSKVQNISREIDVRGMLVNEAESVVGKFLDEACRIERDFDNSWQRNWRASNWTPRFSQKQWKRRKIFSGKSR